MHTPATLASPSSSLATPTAAATYTAAKSATPVLTSFSTTPKLTKKPVTTAPSTSASSATFKPSELRATASSWQQTEHSILYMLVGFLVIPKRYRDASPSKTQTVAAFFVGNPHIQLIRMHSLEEEKCSRSSSSIRCPFAAAKRSLPTPKPAKMQDEECIQTTQLSQGSQELKAN
ncbi:hypothetical protein GOP47_0022650 [Adiantum capillus-veneris]|uniref:Uncharacterized protein n=1 Tax=Adiantum capillus-veneris TaxID=13818 RepID=A0A9D4Z719_ADICA|nr:hypothetical protein GOP47_0022650 [Adiantum capillus-veneris]